jgi:hypothetical membrane protein
VTLTGTTRWWGLLTATVTPVALIGGWVIGARVQPAGYDPARRTISALAAYGAADRWIMTAALYAVGVCNILTAIALAGLRRLTRLLLAAAGVAGVDVAVFAQPHTGSSSVHVACATLSIGILAVWPATVRTRESSTSLLLSGRCAGAVTVVLVGLDVWLFAAGQGVGELGVAERVATGAQNVWPLAVVAASRREAAKMHS